MSAVHETCACGATFEHTSTERPAYADAECRSAAKAWRVEHRHEMPQTLDSTPAAETGQEAPRHV